MAQCPHCGSEWMTEKLRDAHARVCRFGHVSNEYETRLNEFKAKAGKC